MSETDTRPDPDRLLGNILEEEEHAFRGRLKVFFGMAAGVGKTYAMLEEAYRLSREGCNIVIGYVELHGRKETEALIRDLAVLPRKTNTYNGFSLDEFDIDGTLELKPEYVVIDELAHTNADGSRHLKRYQDVIEILDAGINVLTTLNIQHLESQADIVEKITGIRVRETLPDSVLDRADEIELIDIPTEQLIKRLREGKVYIPERAGAAENNFFKAANITALRELSLKYMAHRVDRDLDDYTRKKDIQGAWKSGEKIIVAVSPSPYSEYLIRWTRRMAFSSKLNWIALYIGDDRKLSDGAKEKLHHNLSVARELGAEVISTYDDNIVSGLLRVARQKNVTQIIVGKPLHRYFSDYIHGGTLVERILKHCGDIEVHVVTQPDPAGKKKFLRIPFIISTSPLRNYVKAVASVALITGISLMIVSLVGYWTIAFLYLLCVVFAAMIIGRGPVLITAILSGMLWNYLFIPPLYTFRIGKLEDAMMFIVYVVIALVLGGMTSKLHIKEHALRKRETIISNLYELSNMFENTHGVAEVTQVAIDYIRTHLGMKSAIYISRDGKTLERPEGMTESLVLSEKDAGIVDWVFKNFKPAGLYTKTLPKAGAFFVPMRSPSHVVGVIALVPENRAPLSLETENFIHNIVSQIAIRLEHELLSLSRRQSFLIAESDRLHRTLLNTISHELRTPLTAITGASTSLLDDQISDKTDIRKALTVEIKKASDRLNHLVDNLLDMSRLESGYLKLNRQFHDVHDLIGVSVRRLNDDIVSHQLAVRVADDVPLVSMDFALMEQAVTNLLYNALLYTPNNSSIEIEAIYQNAFVTIAVKDNGPGLLNEDIPYLFEKFRRGSKVMAGGTGLGLSICKGIVEAHGGTIRAMNRSGGGSVFVIELPADLTDKGE